LFIDKEIVRVFGKGSKQRLIPIGETAIKWIREYQLKVRPKFVKITSGDILFLSNRKECFYAKNNRRKYKNKNDNWLKWKDLDKGRKHS
jgi:site-specific recombinase XerD